MQQPDRKRYRIVAHLSSAPATLKVAEALQELAKKTRDCRKELLAASVVAAATALAQAIDATLAGIAGQEWGRGEVDSKDPKHSSVSEVLDLSLRQKVIRLPRILSENGLRLKEDHRVTRALHRLIDRRNELVHIKDEPHLLTDDDSSVKFTADDRMEIRIRIPKNPWLAISTVEARDDRAAVRAYVEMIPKSSDPTALGAVPFLEPLGRH